MRRVFRLPGTKRRAENELDEELRFHIEGRIEELMEQEGFSRDDAEREVERRFGNVDEYRRQARAIDDHILERSRRMDIVETLTRESRHAVRSLPGDASPEATGPNVVREPSVNASFNR